MSLLLFDVETDDADEIEERLAQVSAVFVRHNGAMLPQRFSPDELQDETDLAALRGGGVYEVIGKDARSRFIGKRTHRIEGAPSPAKGATTEPAPAPAARSGGIGELVPLLTFMGQMSAQQSQMMMAMMDSSTKTMVAMMSNSKADSAVLIEALARTQQASAENQSRFFEAMMKNKGGDADGQVEKFFEGLAMGKELDDDKTGDAVSETMNTVAQTIAGLSALAPSTPTGGAS